MTRFLQIICKSLAIPVFFAGEEVEEHPGGVRLELDRPLLDGMRM